MPAQDWNYVENQFDLVTQHSQKRMNALAIDHLAKLSGVHGNVHVAALFARTKPLVLHWSHLYTVWLNTKSVHDGTSSQLEGKLEELGSKRLSQWETAVATSYEPQSPRFVGIFPAERASLLHGTVDDQITELHALAARVRSVGDLDSLAREIDTFGTELESLRTVQQRLELETTKARQALEPQRKLLAVMLFRNLGALIEIYADDPSQIASFFNLDLLHGGGEEDDNELGELSVSPTKSIVAHMAPMVGSLEPPIAVTGRRGTSPNGNAQEIE